MNSKGIEKVAKNNREAQTSDQRNIRATAEQTYANSTALSSQFEFSNYEEDEEDKAFSYRTPDQKQQDVTTILGIDVYKRMIEIILN